MSQHWFDRIGALAGIEREAQALLAAVPSRRLKKGAVLFRAGDEARAFLIVLDGRVTVNITGPTGREIMLYEVASGETCVQTTLAMLAGQPYEGEATVTESAEAVAIPRPVFDRLLAESEPFRAFVFASFGRRLTDVIHLLEKVAFVPIESRLAAMLLDRAGGTDQVSVTHQDLASAIGSAREVVSRRLDGLRDRGMVELARGVVTILDRKALQAIAGGAW
ncbi:MAG: Crp/Fnr family transcriptional regulator [Bauldia sp.]|nr:Crp/Fnr family transcriptional regulator [Bauldia sp.]